MTAHLDLLAQAATSATRAASFADDEPIESRAIAALEAVRGGLRSYGRALVSPARAAQQTAAALGLDAEIDPALRDCDYGRWRGFALQEIEAREPKGAAEWLDEAAAAPHDGESIEALILRTDAWLKQEQMRSGRTLAITHGAVIRAAIVSALGANTKAFWRIDVAPLSLLRLSGRAGRWNVVTLSTLGERPP